MRAPILRSLRVLGVYLLRPLKLLLTMSRTQTAGLLNLFFIGTSAPLRTYLPLFPAAMKINCAGARLRPKLTLTVLSQLSQLTDLFYFSFL